jgi:hypothetical protein
MENKMKIIPALATIALVCGTYNIALADSTTANDAIRAKYNFTYSKDFQEKIDDKYGNREKKTLEDLIIKETYPLVGNDAAKIDIEIIDATPNRPTFEEMNKTGGLSFQSFGIGGANLKGTIYDNNGKVIKSADYQYYSTMDSMTPYKWTWDDAEYAFEKFAKKLSIAQSTPK